MREVAFTLADGIAYVQAKAGCTLGEIADAMRGVFGEYREVLVL